MNPNNQWKASEELEEQSNHKTAAGTDNTAIWEVGVTADGAFRLEDVRVADLQALSAAPHLSVRLFANVVAL